MLNGIPSAEKYNGGYETRLFKRARDFIDSAEQRGALEDLFKLFVLNCALRNGDVHLKNFGVIYEDVTGPARLAPVYDLVSTLALSAEGWHGAYTKRFHRLARSQSVGSSWPNST